MPNAQRFGSYFLLKKIATGGMAELYKAKKSGEKGFEKLLAIKMILPHLSANEDFISMFIDEAKVAALLNHQNIVQIYDLGKIENAYCIVMEYVRGKDLKSVLSRAAKTKSGIGVEHACLITASALSGLAYAHRKKDKGHELRIVHRDISPPNILVTYEGEVKIVDFGIAKAATQSMDTKVGVLKGKISYMSPEQAMGKPLDHRSDIFSMGVVLYEMLTGKKLFHGDTDLNTLEQVRAAKVEPLPHELNAEVPKELEEILLKALEKEPDARFQGASEMEEALQQFMRHAGYSSGSYSLSQYMYRLFRDDIEEEMSEEEGWDQTIVSEGVPADTPAAPVGDAQEAGKPKAPPAPEPSAVREIGGSRGMPLLPKVVAAVVASVILAFGGYWFLTRPGTTGPQPEKAVQQTTEPPKAVAVPAIKAEEKQAPAAPEPPPPAPKKPPAAPKKEKAAAPAMASTSISVNSTPSGAKVLLDGQDTGKRTPANIEGIKPGKAYSVKLVLEGYAPFEETAASDGERPGSVNALLVQLFGALSVDSQPWSVVVIDGEEKGTTPIAGIKLSAGEHDLALGNPKLKLGKRMKVHIEPNKTTRLVVNLDSATQ